MPHPITSLIFCINPSNPQHPHVQTRGNRFCTICGSPIALKNRYIPLKQLGSGGFAIIYTVWDLQTQTERVLKVLLETAPKARDLFKQEAEILQSLRHPAVPAVEPDGYFQVSVGNPPVSILPCLVMEKINGQTLEEILASYSQGCPEKMVRNWFQQAIDILRVLHRRQIIHRDLKPSNLMLRQETNQLVLIDFGGAKKLRSALSWSKDSSTRLYSPGYSPPEQSQGLDVEPAADFYALGRTMIQLLTGKPPQELADPVTGELKWRRLVRVSPEFANLLDDLVRENARQRPTNAAKIQQRLEQSSPHSAQQQPFSQIINSLSQAAWRRSHSIAANLTQRLAKINRSLTQTSWQQSPVVPAVTQPLGKTNRVLTQTSWKRSSRRVSAFTKPLERSARFLLKFVTQLGRACLDTIGAMVLSTIAACVGTATGFVLAYWSPLGAMVASFLSQQLPQLIQNPQIAVESELVVFAAVGLSTAWGLTIAGGFDQRRRYFISPLSGLSGYILGWLFWLAATPYNFFWGIAGLITVAVAILILGLGLPSRHQIHAIITAFGTTSVFIVLVSLNLFSFVIFHLQPQPSWYDFWVYTAFFSFVSATLSLCLGLSYYVVVPCLRWLGWR